MLYFPKSEKCMIRTSDDIRLFISSTKSTSSPLFRKGTKLTTGVGISAIPPLYLHSCHESPPILVLGRIKPRFPTGTGFTVCVAGSPPLSLINTAPTSGITLPTAPVTNIKFSSVMVAVTLSAIQGHCIFFFNTFNQ